MMVLLVDILLLVLAMIPLVMVEVSVMDGCRDVIIVVTTNNVGVVSAAAVSVVMMSAMMTLITMTITTLIGGDRGVREGLGYIFGLPPSSQHRWVVVVVSIAEA